MNNVSIDDLATAVAKELSEYSQDVNDKLKDEVKQVAKECRDEIAQNSPVRTGKYKKGWKTDVEYEGKDDIRVIVHNKKYQITHFLEYGHRGKGGILKGSAEGSPHIRPAEQHAAEKLQRKVKVIVKE